MLLIRPSFEILAFTGRKSILEQIERAGRTCYKSEDKITETSASEFARRIIRFGHESVIEHVSISVKFVVDRGVSHELVRHRIASYSQESTRYCDYSGQLDVCFVIPPWIGNLPEKIENEAFDGGRRWLSAMRYAEIAYQDLRRMGWSPQEARSVLPNSLKTEIVATMNLREWRHVLKLRTSKKAHPQMQEVMVPLQDELREILPEVFEDFAEEEEADGNGS